MGEGFTWETQDRERDINTAMQAWSVAKTMLENADYQLVVLDELNIALKYHYIPLDDVLDALACRPVDQHVVVTGRSAPKALIDAADTVTEMQAVKHAFQAGVSAQKGIEL
jgi:cob(I)alamin adenosyltransferase